MLVFGLSSRGSTSPWFWRHNLELWVCWGWGHLWLWKFKSTQLTQWLLFALFLLIYYVMQKYHLFHNHTIILYCKHLSYDYSVCNVDPSICNSFPYSSLVCKCFLLSHNSFSFCLLCCPFSMIFIWFTCSQLHSHSHFCIYRGISTDIVIGFIFNCKLWKYESLYNPSGWIWKALTSWLNMVLKCFSAVIIPNHLPKCLF